MRINVVVRATQVTEYVYEITNVDSLKAAQKCAMRAAYKQYQPNAWMARKVPYPPTFTVDSCKIVEVN